MSRPQASLRTPLPPVPDWIAARQVRSTFSQHQTQLPPAQPPKPEAIKARRPQGTFKLS